MQLAMVSDTHGAHPAIPSADVLIHAGDLTHYGSFAELKSEVNWLKSLPHRNKLFVPGNHDVAVENILNNGLIARLREMLHPIILLHDSWVVIDGVKFYGSPWIPKYAGAFNLSTEELKAKWKLIPDDVTVLITHGPPRGTLDGGIGCDELAGAVNRIKPRVHCFGHVHEHAGSYANEITSSYNCSDQPLVYSNQMSIARPVLAL